MKKTKKFNKNRPENYHVHDKGKVLDVEQIACVDKFQVRARLITC